MRVLLTGGGSGGHVYPAIAIADTIRMNIPDAEIAFVGVKGGTEADIVPREGSRLYYVESQGLRRSLSLSNVKALITAVTSPHSKATRKLLSDFRPDIVIGTGGYVCWPLLRAAACARIPTMVHESNCKPGLAVRMLQYSVDAILLNFEETREQLSCRRKCITVGNPLRGAFDHIPRAAAREKLGLGKQQQLVLCYAGSLGSESVNAAVLDMLKTLAPARPGVRFVLATGTGNYATAKQLYDEYELGNYPNVVMQPYIYDMPTQLSAADIVISRAGAMSLSELSHMGKAAIVIPSPYVADDHQLCNAKALAERGAAILVEERDFSGGALSRAVNQLIDAPEQRALLEKKIKSFSEKDANRLIYDEIVARVQHYHRTRKKK